MAGSHDGQYMAFELDITKYVRYNSPNELAVSIFKDSKISISSSRNTGYIHGDITRSVELLAVPELHISKIYINTDFDKEFTDGKLKIDCQITNNESKALKPQIRFNLTGPKGEQISLFPLKEDLAVIQAQSTIRKQLDITIPKAVKWDYEHPNLYKLTVELILENQSCEIVSQNIGFRKVEIRGNEIFLNNRSIKIKGTNYHPSHPLTGWALPKEFAIKHIKLLKEANINFVRIWPHMEEFIDECDKAGMLLQVEVPFSFLSQDKFLQDSLYVKDGIKLAVEMTDYYRNHPSVVVWSVGNESSYLPVFEHMAVSIKKADNSRPVIMSENSARGLGIPSLDFDTEHYPAINACGRSDISRPILYTEWSHTNSYNIPEFTTDPGLRDYWVNFLKPHIEYIYNNKDGSIGGCLFTSISLTYWFPPGIEGATSHPPVWGFIDEWCRPQPEYWHVKKSNSPVQITNSKSSEDKVQLTVESRFDFTNMNELNINWKYGNQSGKIFPDIKPRSKGIIEIPLKTNNADKLHITFNSPYGYIIDEYEFNFNNGTIKKPVMTAGLKAPEINETDSLIFVKSKNLVYTFSKNTGFLKSVKDNIGNIILHNTPEFFAAETPQNIKDIVLTGWKLGNLKCNSSGNKVIVNVTGKYNEAEGKYAFTINGSNEFSIDYEFKWTANDRTVKETGICLKMPETFNILTWKRKGFWNYYPSDHIGRIDGTALMFRNKTFTLPDPRKGPDWNWEQDETLNGTNDFRSTKYNIYNASLSDTEYKINVLSDGNQNIRTWYNNESRNTSMLVTYISNGGWESFLRGDANLRSDLFYLKTGDVIKDKVCFNIEKMNKNVLLDAEMAKTKQQPAPKMSRNNMITPGLIWNDSDGKPIESHLGGMLFEDGVYYWYGMNWDGPTIPPNTIPQQSYSWFLNQGITVYSSKDLYQWKHESTVLTEVGCEPGHLLQPLNGLVRPKVIRNNTTGKYVMMAALTSPDFETFNDIVVAVGDSPVGPFELRGKLGWLGTPNMKGLWTRVWKQAATDKATRIRGFDMGLFKDDDGKAFLMVAHGDVFIYELSEDYLSVARVERMDGVEGEAPAMFKADGTYYLLTSRLSGWAPNQNTYFTAGSIWGPWKQGGPFAKGPKEQTTFDSQVTFVLPVANKPNAFIFMADLFHCVSGTDVPDLRKAVHVWLPIELDRRNHSIHVIWKNQWDMSIFD